MGPHLSQDPSLLPIFQNTEIYACQQIPQCQHIFDTRIWYSTKVITVENECFGQK